MDVGNCNEGVMSKTEYMASVVGHQPTTEITIKDQTCVRIKVQTSRDLSVKRKRQ